MGPHRTDGPKVPRIIIIIYNTNNANKRWYSAGLCMKSIHSAECRWKDYPLQSAHREALLLRYFISLVYSLIFVN